MFGKAPPEGTVAGLADAIKALRAELNTAMADAASEEIKFTVGAVTMEVAVEARADAEATGGVKFWVVELGGKGSQPAERWSTERFSVGEALATPPAVGPADVCGCIAIG